MNLFTGAARLVIVVMASALAVGATACGGDGGEAPKTPSPEGGATPTVTAEGAEDAALAAILEYIGAVSDADCESNNPQNKPCAGLSSQPSTVQHGIAVFDVGPLDAPGFVVVMGRDPAGEWKFWRVGQDDHQLLTLPGDALVCGYGGGLNVGSAPETDAAAVGVLEDLTTVRAEEFVLTEPGSDPAHGYGWFRLSSPLDGWAYSRYLTNASLGDCSSHDSMEPGSPGL